MPAKTDIIEKLPPQSRVAIIRLRSLGDCVLLTPAIDILRYARPDLEIAVVVENRFADIFARALPPSARAIRDSRPIYALTSTEAPAARA